MASACVQWVHMVQSAEAGVIASRGAQNATNATSTWLRRRRSRLGSAAANELMSFNRLSSNSNAYCEYSLSLR